MDVVSGVENKMASDGGAGDVEGESNDKCTKENILYDLTIQAEWQQDQEIFVRICCFVGSLHRHLTQILQCAPYRNTTER